MDILVCVKRVPDTWENEIEVNRDGSDIDRSDLVYSVNEWDNYAVEEAIQIRDNVGGSVTVVTVGDEEAEEVLRREMAMGADNGVHLADGTHIDADLVISATGVRPNVGFLDGSGIRVEQGVVIDRHFRTSVADIYAAGDVAQGLDFCTGEYAVHAIQPTAADHGHLAAANMSGHDTQYEGSMNMNVLDTLGLLSCSFGSWQGVEGGEQAQLYAPDDWRYLSLQFDGDRIVGANAVGLVQHVGILRGLIQRRTSLGVWKSRLMRDPTRLMEAYIATTEVV